MHRGFTNKEAYHGGNMTTLKEWAEQWKKCRDDKTHNLESVLEVWNKDSKQYGRKHESWLKMSTGFRKNCKNDSGEKKYERALLGNDFFYVINAKGVGAKSLKLEVKNHAWALANEKRGQTITDCMGVLYHKRNKHLVAIEIKRTANDPWYAVVEVLQQVRLMRSNVEELKKYYQKKFSYVDVKGAWGMLLAPEDYYEKGNHAGSYKAACELCKYMERKTEARVIIASLDLGIIKYKSGFWPR